MINILVCVKQVPDVDQMKMDPLTGTLIREGVPAILNPNDANALSAAVSVKESCEASITAISMGPPSADVALRSCIAMGADRAILLSDRAFANADTLATSYVVAMGARSVGSFDLIICGKETLDGATGQMGSQLAERFSCSQLTGVSKIIKVDPENRTILAERLVEGGTELREVSLPCLLTMEKENYPARIPNIKRNIMSKKAQIPILCSADLADLDPNQIGDAGSPTKVPRMFPPVLPEPGLVLREGSLDERVDKIMAYLQS